MGNPVKIQAEVIEKNSIFEGVFELIMHPRTQRKIKFLPGQFLHFTLESFDPCGGFWPDSRVFSIASSTESDTIRVIISVKGFYTARIAAEIVVGSQVWLKLPFGDFSIQKNISPKVKEIILIAGGTGISPFLSFLESVNDMEMEQKISLYWGVKHPSIFSLGKSVLGNLTGVILNNPLKVHLFSEESPTENIHYEYLSGILDIEEIYFNNTGPDSIYFLSGPPRMISTFKEFLLNKNIDTSKIIIDNWE